MMWRLVGLVAAIGLCVVLFIVLPARETAVEPGAGTEAGEAAPDKLFTGAPQGPADPAVIASDAPLPPEPSDEERKVGEQCRPIYDRLVAIGGKKYAEDAGDAVEARHALKDVPGICEKLLAMTDDQIKAELSGTYGVAVP